MKLVHVREIHEIELSSVCNLRCRYCPHPHLEREKAHMGWEVFERTLEHLEYFVKAGTQREVSLTGIGEAILHPRFEEALRYVRACVGWKRDLVMSTNGVAMTPSLAKLLASQGVIVYVSLHQPVKAGPAYEMLAKAGCILGKNTAFVESAFDWAGQVKWHVSAPTTVCKYLSDAWCVIRQDGSVDACCLDAHSVDSIGHVNDDLGSLKTRVISLCATCHMTVPDSLAADVLMSPAVTSGAASRAPAFSTTNELEVST